MPLKTLVVIALRLYAIYWLVDGVSALAVYVPTLLAFMSQVSSIGGMQGSSPFSPNSLILLPLGSLAFSFALWFLASRLSSLVTKDHDTQLTFTYLTKEDIYRFAFVFLGLFFALSSIYSIVQTSYRFFAFDFPQPDSNPHKGELFWPLFGHALTMIAGFACVCGARKWTNKLIRLENEDEAPPPA